MSILFKINNVDVTDQVLMKSVVINDQINQKTNTLNFKVEKYSGVGYVPELNHEVEVFHDGNKIFGGVLIQFSENVVGHTIVRYSVKAKDYAQHIDRKLITERYEDQTVTEIIDDLVTRYASDFTSLVNQNINIASISFNRLTMTQALQKIANALNFVWWIDYEKNIHMLKKNEQLSPFGLSDVAENHIWGTLNINKDISQVRNVIIVEGGDEISDEKTVEYFGDGDTKQFDTLYKFARKPEVVVDGVTQTVGLDNVSDEASFDYMWSFNEKYVRSTTNAPSLKDPSSDNPNVQITGQPLFPILVKVPDPVSIGQYGEYEFAIKDRTIKSKQQGIDRAVAELQAYADKISEGGFKTYKFGLESGQTINVQSDLRGMSENFIIQKVTTRFIGDGTGEKKAEYDITFATLKTIGIIDVLQKLLLDEEISEGERDVLLTYLQFSDEFQFSDDDLTLTTQNPPYVYDDGTESISDAKYNYSTWA